jgi:hypothetical protein
MDWNIFLAITHIIGTSLGVGGATVSDFLFFKILKSGKIEEQMFGFLKTVSGVVWFGLFVLAFSGVGFLILHRIEGSEFYVLSSNFWAKMTVVLIIFFNGLIMHWKVFPIFERCSEKRNNNFLSEEFVRHISVIFTTGAISIISWYSALILGVWRGLIFSYLELILVYLFIIISGVIVSNIIGKVLVGRLKKL